MDWVTQKQHFTVYSMPEMSHCWLPTRKVLWSAREMAPQGNALAVAPDSLVPGIYMMEGEKQSLQVVLCPPPVRCGPPVSEHMLSYLMDLRAMLCGLFP